jgi:hypothetical protein
MNRLARLLISGGILGAAVAVLNMLIPPAVGPERWSYPYTATGFVLTEIPIVIAHVLTALGILALTDHVGSSRAGFIGVRVAAAGLWLLAVCEVAAAAIAGVLANSVQAQLVGAAFGVTSLVYAIGAVAGGIALVQLRAGQPWARWSLLTSGVFVVAVVDPATLAGGPLVRYLALALWSLMFCWMASLVASPHRAAVDTTRHVSV